MTRASAGGDPEGAAMTTQPAARRGDVEVGAAMADDERTDDGVASMDDEFTRRRASAAMLGAAGVAEGDDGTLAQLLMARLFPSQVRRPKIGRFDLLAFLGEGGMGAVYAAYDARLDRRVAIKFLRARAGDDERAEARLLREAQALARLSHPNVVQVHEAWEEDGRIHVAMEFVDGESLDAWLREPRPWREVVAVYRQAGEGLSAAHDADLIHRDFKPHNVIRRRDGVVKVLDFGLARVGAAAGERASGGRHADAVTPDLTRTGVVMGTPLYMAPEQHEGAAADARSDQYSFCVALWEGLYGQLPHTAGSLAALQANVLAGERIEPRDPRGVPAWIRRVLDRGLARDPAARYPSMRELIRDLDRDPAVRRRRGLVAAAGIVATIAGGLVIAEVRAPAAAPSCEVAPAEVDALWGAARRASVEAGILAGGEGFAHATWSRVQGPLERYVAELISIREEACATHRRGLHSDALHDLRVACLDRGQAAFVRLADLLAAGERGVILRAATAVAELPPLVTCSDTVALASEIPPPTDGPRAAEVAALREELARAQSEESAGKYVDAEARAATVVDAAARLDYPPLAAEALLRWGSAAMQRGDRVAGERLDLSLWTALRAEHRRVAAEAAAKRIYARLELDDRSADVGEALALAASLAERVGAGDWRSRWLLDNNAAIADERRGALESALAAYKRALARIPAGEGASFERAATLQNMAPLQVRRGERAEGEAAARQAVEEFRGLYGPEHPSTASAEAVSAVILAKVGRRAEASRLLAAAIERATAASGAPPLWMVLEAARQALARGDLAAARRWCERAEPQIAMPGGARSPWDLPFAAVRARLAALAGDPNAASILDVVDPAILAQNHDFVALERARIAWALGRVDEAEARALALVDSAGEVERDEARILVARALVARGAHDEAAARLAEVLGEGGSPRLHEASPRALALRTLAVAEAGRGRPTQARARAREAVDALAEFDADDPELAEARANLAAIVDGPPEAVEP